MRAVLSLSLLVVVVAALGLSAPRWLTADEPRPKQEARVRLLVPAYFYPAGPGLKEWERLLAVSTDPDYVKYLDEVEGVVVIINPASGPGKEADPNYVKILDRIGKAGNLTPIGYVSTSYGKRPLADVEANVDRWLKLYPGIGGIFFDEQASGDDRVGYQRDLYDYVRTRKGLKLVVTNPGTVCAEKYLSEPATDVACLFEGPKAFDPSAFPGWVGKYAPAHVAAVSYQVGTAESMRACVRTAAEKKVGYCYVTDAEGANPWDRLPRYWEEEVAAVREANGLPGLPTGRGTLTGKVTLVGAAPDLAEAAKRIEADMKMHKDHEVCLSAKSAEEKSPQSWIIKDVGGAKRVKNVFVWLRPPDGCYFKIPQEALEKAKEQTVTLDQPHCAFIPHALTLWPSYIDPKTKKVKPTGQKFVVKNSAVIDHNVKWKGSSFNDGNITIKAKGEIAVELRADPKPVVIACNIHGWMTASALVLDHPFVAVTDDKGEYKIENVPTGVDLQVVAWHEATGYLTKGKAKGDTIKLGKESAKNFEIAVPK
jgi:hypothetical protein